MAESDTPERPRYNLGGLQSFIPLQDDAAVVVSTRGHRLPSIFKSRSNASLFTMPKRQRRGSRSSAENDEESGMIDDNSAFPRRPTRDLNGVIPEIDARRMSLGPEILMTPQMRSMRLIGNPNPRYRWQRYYRTEEELKTMKKKVRVYYERTNFLISQYLYIDRLLDSSLPHNLIQEYNEPLKPLHPITEEETNTSSTPTPTGETPTESHPPSVPKLKRTPKNLYKIPDEQSPLLGQENIDTASTDDDDGPNIELEEDEDVDSSSPVVTVAIYLNLTANIILLAAKIAVIILTSSLSVLASLVDAALDFLSTAIVWTTTFLIQRQDQYAYPIGRRRLEPVGVLVFSVVMITSFFQVALECFNRLTSGDHAVVELTLPAIFIMASTVIIKGFLYFWCRFIHNSSVQALAQDALTDVVFNTFSIIFPLIGAYAKIWWLDALGGLLLSFYVIFNWSNSASEHIRNLSGAAASADERNVLLYLTMRFAKTIRYIQGLQAYHAGDKLNVEVDIVLDEDMNLKDSHDLSESLQYVLESVPTVDRAFVHADYKRENLPSHMNQQG